MFRNGKLRASRTDAINFTSGVRSGLASHRLSARAAVSEYTDWGLTQQTLALTGLAVGRLCQGAGLGGFLGRRLPGSVLTQPSLWPRSRPLLIQRESHSEGLTSASPPPQSPSSRYRHTGGLETERGTDPQGPWAAGQGLRQTLKSHRAPCSETVTSSEKQT